MFWDCPELRQINVRFKCQTGLYYWVPGLFLSIFMSSTIWDPSPYETILPTDCDQQKIAEASEYGLKKNDKGAK